MSPQIEAADVDRFVSATIRGLAAARQLTTADLAAISGVGTTQLNAKLQGRSPWKLREVTRLAAHFQVTLDDLVHGRVALTPGPNDND